MASGCVQVVISDFPDPALVNNLAKNVEVNVNALGDEPRVADATAMVSRPASPGPVMALARRTAQQQSSSAATIQPIRVLTSW